MVEHVDEELLKIVSAALVSQSTSFKTASIHCPLLPTICTVWDQVEEEVLVVVVVVVADVDPVEVTVSTGELLVMTDLLWVPYCKNT